MKTLDGQTLTVTLGPEGSAWFGPAMEHGFGKPFGTGVHGMHGARGGHGPRHHR